MPDVLTWLLVAIGVSIGGLVLWGVGCDLRRAWVHRHDVEPRRTFHGPTKRDRGRWYG